MKKFLQIMTCLLVFFYASGSLRAEQEIVLGLDQPQVYGPMLKGLRVGLMVNQSSINKDGRHAIDKLLEEQKQYGFTVTTLYSVEHGLRGKHDAGFGDDSHLDSKSGLPIVSLYGHDADGRSRANPTAEQLANVDIVIYDLQDVGVRFFTYTISMHHMMESLQLQKKKLMVFDRPNPLGADVYGPILKEEYISGIGMHPVPMVHGLTSGEFASMIVGEKWLTHFDKKSWQAFGTAKWQLPPTDLLLIKMQNYRHDRHYSLPVRPSPNLRTDLAVALYPSLGVFEATSVNMGRGSAHPFEQLGFPDKRFYVNTCYHVDINQQKAGWPQAGKEVCGERLTTDSVPHGKATIRLFAKWWYKFAEAGYQLVLEDVKESDYLKWQEQAFLLRPLWLAKLTGDRSLEKLLLQALKDKLPLEEAVQNVETSWKGDLDKYLQLRQKYLLYP
ncbi:DUF1343 domain-containing protein [Enterobacter hormaechei]|uniref:exo-beta-N-acetylmuramidase NamZ family protein n=1 Tax=Enterobacter hormaechei TaxID=158836 RepID=UPI00294A7808|nr:DUF1343 domain-containing protein [Enterobacter hormaechei]MDV5373168.1 DUF1343 domain-containing protein [Enterobacter hormaechei]